MSRENIELVRRLYESWNSRGLEALEPGLADDVELQDAPELPDSAGWHGRDAVLARLAEVAGAVGGGWVELHDLRAFGDEVLVSMVWQTDDAPGSAAFGPVFHLVRVSEGKVDRLRVFLQEQAALDALGA